MSETIVRFGVNPPAIETGKPNDVLSGAPVTRVQNYFTDASGQFFAGIWESSIGKWRIRYTESEFCILLEGIVVLTDQNGKSETFRRGDSFVIPSGYAGTWETVEPVRKHYVIFESKS
jgi:hypothetical protein